jgi:hypothetical protein
VNTLYRIEEGPRHEQFVQISPVDTREYLGICQKCFRPLERLECVNSRVERIYGSAPFVGDFILLTRLAICREKVAQSIIREFSYLRLEQVTCVKLDPPTETYELVICPDSILEVAGFPILEFDAQRSTVVNQRRCERCNQMLHTYPKEQSGNMTTLYSVNSKSIVDSPLFRLSGTPFFFCDSRTKTWLEAQNYSNLQFKAIGYVD